MSERIDHVKEAEQYLRASKETPSDIGPTADPWLLSAQVHATLALVEQQRIANLIALTKFAVDKYGNYAPRGANIPALFSDPPTLLGSMRLNPEIAAALGIKEEK